MKTPSPNRWISILALIAAMANPLPGQDEATTRAQRILAEARGALTNTRYHSPWAAELRLAISVAQARAGDPAAADAGFQEILAALPHEGANVALAKFRAGDLKGAIALAETLKDGWIAEPRDPLSASGSARPGSLRTHALEQIAALLGEKRQWTEARAVAELLPEAKREGHPDDMTSRQEALGKLSIAQAKAGELGSALRTAKIITSGYYRQEAVKELVLEHIRRGELKEAAQADELLTYRHLKLVTLLSMAKAQASQGDRPASAETFQKAIELASKLIDFRVGPSSRVSALVQISEAEIQTGDRKAAEETLTLARDGSTEFDFYRIAEGEARLGAIEHALAKVESISVPWRRVSALTGIARVLAQGGNSAKADEVCAKARTQALTMKDDYNRTRLLLEIGKAQLDSSLVSAALETAKECNPLYSEKGDLLQRIIKVQVAQGDLKGARKTAELHPIAWMKANAFYDIAPAMARAGDAQPAIELVDPLQGNVRSLSLEAISSILAERGEFGPAREAALRIEMSEIKERALRTVAFVHTGTGDEAGARAWISKLEPPFLKAPALLGVAEAILRIEGRKR